MLDRGEGQHLEFMGSYPENGHELSKEIAAFASSKPPPATLRLSHLQPSFSHGYQDRQVPVPLAGLDRQYHSWPGTREEQYRSHQLSTARPDPQPGGYRQDLFKSAVDVAMATAAAPTFFPAYSSSNGPAYIDGGVWANNPAMLGVLEAICILKQIPQVLDLLSVGTTTEPFYVTKCRRMGGILQWHKGIVDLLLQAQSDSILGQVKIMTGKVPLRIDVSVTPGRFALNDARTIADLVALGNREARIHCAEFADRFLVEPAEPFIPVFTTTPSGRALAVFAEFERDILRDRVKAGIDQARKDGKPHGRPMTAGKLVGEMEQLRKSGPLWELAEEQQAL